MNTHSTPIVLLTGHLGAGKTTLLNRLLQLDQVRRRRTAIIVNEFGPRGVDATRIEHEGAELIELNHGSLFCACLTKDFLKTLDVLAEQVHPELVLIEATGVAETGDLVPLLQRDVDGSRFHVHANLAVVDAVNFTKVLPYMQAVGRQVRQADGLVVGKVDRLTDAALARLDELLASLSPDTPICHAAFGDAPWEFVELAATKRRQREVEAGAHGEARHDSPPRDIVTVSVDVDRADRQTLWAIVRRLDRHLLRMKGYVDFGQGPVFVESVFGETSETPVDPEDESQSAEGQGGRPRRWRYGLVAIGWRISADQLRAELSACEA